MDAYQQGRVGWGLHGHCSGEWVWQDGVLLPHHRLTKVWQKKVGRAGVWLEKGAGVGVPPGVAGRLCLVSSSSHLKGECRKLGEPIKCWTGAG